MLKLALQQRKRHAMHRDKILPWASCAPFVENSRGVLIHRPRWRADHRAGNRRARVSVQWAAIFWQVKHNAKLTGSGTESG